MNIQENIKYLSQANSKLCYPQRKESIDQTIPFFEIYKNQFGRYDVNPYNYQKHDNADRMEIWLSYLKYSIFPNVDPCVDLCGYYNIQLHDSYTYLNDQKDYSNVLTFSKFKDDTAILIPDPYMIMNYGNVLQNINDEAEWSKKLSKICFCGTTTGNTSPNLNDRINMCLWAKDKRNWFDAYITKVAQIDPVILKNKVPDFDSIYHTPLSIHDQLKYKYHLAMDGNTSRFDVWYYKVNNVVMKHESKEMLWYYPLIQNDIHYVEVNKNTIKNKLDFFENNPQLAYCMIYNAKNMVNTLFRPLIHQMYTINLFENIGNNR